MAYTNLKIGSSGDDVKKLQQTLIAQGYDLGEDGESGVFGKATDAAVRSYQQNNNLTVDGIAGNNTQTSLYGASSESTTDKSKMKSPIAGVNQDVYDRMNEIYKQSDAVKKAWEAIEALKAQMQGGTKYSESLDAIIQKIMDRPAFSYNADEDPLFQQMLASQTRSGEKAMNDAIAKSSSLTGGYANSWAQTAGQQTYDQYLQSAYDQLPQYYQLAMNAHNMETEDLLRQYSMLSESDQREFDRLLSEIGVATDLYDRLSAEDRRAFEDRVGNAKDIAAILNSDYWKEIERQLAKEQNAIARAQKETRYVQRDKDEYDAQMDAYLEGLKSAIANGTQADYLQSIKGNLSSAELSALMQAAGLSTNNFSKVVNNQPSWAEVKKSANAFMGSTSFANMTAREQQNALKRFLKNYENTTVYSQLKAYLHL